VYREVRGRGVGDARGAVREAEIDLVIRMMFLLCNGVGSGCVWCQWDYK